jgi:peptidoglycan/LPS O-acetylase OafA/YrhL
MKKTKSQHKVPPTIEPVTHAGVEWSSLTGLRGVAALWVFLLHAYILAGAPNSLWAPVAWLAKMGWMGVDIFFSLSAFLLSIPFARAWREQSAAPSQKSYFIKRAARIFPAYYLQCLVLAIIFYAGISKAVFLYEPTALSGLLHAGLLFNLLPSIPALVQPWWTLPVEFGFYLLLPWLAKCLTDQRWGYLLIGIVISLLYRYVLLHAGFSRPEEIYWGEHLPGRLFQFLIGMLVAFFWVKCKAQNRLPSATMRTWGMPILLAGLVALPAFGWLVSDFPFNGGPTTHPVLQFGHLFASLLIAGILMLLASGDSVVARCLSVSPLQWLGKISYGVYLWHYPVMLVLRETMGGNDQVKENFLAYFFYSFAVSITLAFLSWHWLEQPILNRVNKKSSSA